MKPVDKQDAIDLKNFARVDDFLAVDERFKRDERRTWKKVRTRHLRNQGKRDLQKFREDL